MKILLKFPTRNRPNKFLNVLKKYVKKMTGDNYQIVVSCDTDDESMHDETVVEVLDRYKNLEVCYGNNKNKIEAINADMDQCTDYDIIILISDDMIPLQKGWDDIIRNDMKEHFPDTDGILWYHDGHRKDLNTLCVLGKKYYERFGYIYHPDYKSFFCDDEFTKVGDKLGKQKFIDNVIIQHQHPVWGYGANDELYNKNLTYWGEDEAMFKKREALNFELPEKA